MLAIATAETIVEAATLIKRGELVAFPTETVYGLGADATNGMAAARIFEVKGRPRFNPLIAHVPELASAREFANFNDQALVLARAFWPGSLTLVLPLAKGARTPISQLVTAGLDTVAIRVPDHPVALDLLRAAGLPIAAPSANLSGRMSPTRAEHVELDLGSRVSLILDGGPASAGVESTILAFDPEPILLRPGAVARQDIEAVLGRVVGNAKASLHIRAPGQLTSHYAPQARVRLHARSARPGEVLLGFGPDAPNGIENLSQSGDLREAASNLFTCLRALDAKHPEAIAVMPIPETGLGEAINDRLRRASAPR